MRQRYFSQTTIVVHNKGIITLYRGYLLASRRTLIVKMVIEQGNQRLRPDYGLGIKLRFHVKPNSRVSGKRQ